MGGVPGEGMEMVTVTVKLHQTTLDGLERLARGTHRAPGNPTPEALVQWAVDSLIDMREREK